MTDLDSVSNMLAAAEPFQILVNNAGTNRSKPMVEVSLEDFDVIMNLNMRSTFFVAQAVAKRLLPAGLSGSIINVSLQMGNVGAQGDRFIAPANGRWRDSAAPWRSNLLLNAYASTRFVRHSSKHR